MDINTGNSANVLNQYSLQSSGVSTSDGNRIKSDADKSFDKTELANNQAEENKKEELSLEDVTQITEGLNKFMSVINTDLRFTIHEGTNRLMVQFVDTKDHQVIKEFPPHELLDTLAAIRTYVGVLLDKKV